MPRDASGNYTLPAGNPVVSGTTITSIWANATMPDLGAALTDSLSRSGQGGMLVPFRVLDGVVDEPAFSFVSELSLGMYRVSAGVLGFPIGGTLRASVSALLDQPKDVFTNAKLGGYLATGFHAEYTGDLDDIAINSTYHILDSNVTNEPPDFVSARGIITTYHRASDTALQILYGLGTNVAYKAWMRTKNSNIWGAWKLVVDGGAFTQRLAGYSEGGTHDIEWVGSVDDIAFNSVYRTYTATTDLPADYAPTLRGVIFTDMSSTGTGERLQTLVGVGGSNSYKTWQRNRTASWSAWKLVVDGDINHATDSLIIGDRGQLAIAAGAITVTGSFHNVDTEAAAATDNLDTINAASDINGRFLVIKQTTNARAITARTNVGNLLLAGDFVFGNSAATLTLVSQGGVGWLEVSRSQNTQ